MMAKPMMGSRYRSTALSSVTSGEWGNPSYVLAVAAVASFIGAFVVYYTVIPLFRELTAVELTAATDGEGLLHSSATESAWYSTGSGAGLSLIIGLFILAASTCVGLCFAENKESMGAVALAVALLSLIFYFCFQSALDIEPTLFIAWSFLAVLFGLGFIGYGVWQVYKSSKYGDQTTEDDKKFLARKNWIWGFAAVGGILGLIVIAAHWSIYGRVYDKYEALNETA